MITGAPKYVMIVFFGLGMSLSMFSLWALYLTDIPQEQFQNDPRFEKEYIKYYEWLSLFGIILIVIGGIIATLGRKMTKK